VLKSAIYAILVLFVVTSAVNRARAVVQIEKGPGTTYYFDGFRGNDNGNGLTPNSAWKSLSKISQLRLKAGDCILFHRGTSFWGQLKLKGDGTSSNPIIISAYGKGNKPIIIAPDSVLYTVLIKNSNFLTVEDLEIVNKGSHRLAGRTGLKVECNDFGISHNITLNALDIHDVNGSLIKAQGGGSGILIESRWKNTVSRFDSLRIKNCIIKRTARNGIIWSAPYRRDNWHPSTNIIIKGNYLEGVPGDGIVPIGCDNTLIEYNVMRDCPEILPSSEAAAGIWPWSCDNTVIQFNEVSGQRNQWDAQGYDADYNCINTLIQYNYSHDNYGGMVLICNDGGSKYPYNVGNIGSVIRYNISINDGTRPKPARSGKMFSPSIHIAGPVKNTTIEDNVIFQKAHPNLRLDRTMIESDNWIGDADSTFVNGNFFYAHGRSRFSLGNSTNNGFSGNYYLGLYESLPIDLTGMTEPLANSKSLKDSTLFMGMFETRKITDENVIGKFVKKEAIRSFFQNLAVYDQNGK